VGVIFAPALGEEVEIALGVLSGSGRWGCGERLARADGLKWPHFGHTYSTATTHESSRCNETVDKAYAYPPNVPDPRVHCA
jgi:hypothetical protein